MENELCEVSIQGDINSLKELLNANPMLPLDTKFTGNRRTSLHIAAMCGHVKFAQELMRRNSLLIMEKDSHGFTPLHLASARTSCYMVEKLLDGNNQSVCLEEDQVGRTPLHLAVMKDRLQIVKVLLKKKPEAILTRNGQHETVLHHCVKHNNLKALKLLVKQLPSVGALNTDSISVNSRDSHGNTILHLAAERKQIECMKEEKASKEWMKERANALMVVATLIAGIAFQAVMNPPGGVFQEDSKISASDDPITFTYYLGSVAHSYESNRLDKYLKRQPEDTIRNQNRTKIGTDFVRALLKALDNDTYSGPDPYVKRRSPGIVLEHEKWNRIISKYKPRFSPYLIRYAETPILAYRNPILYRIYMISNAFAFIVSLGIIMLVITGYVSENSIRHEISYLVGMMIVSTLGWFISYVVVFASMSPPFYMNITELIVAMGVSIPILSLSTLVYPICCFLQIHYSKGGPEVSFDRKEGFLTFHGFHFDKHLGKTLLRFTPVYSTFFIVFITIPFCYR